VSERRIVVQAHTVAGEVFSEQRLVMGRPGAGEKVASTDHVAAPSQPARLPHGTILIVVPAALAAVHLYEAVLRFPIQPDSVFGRSRFGQRDGFLW
jgi:hypothetical protein